MSASCTFVRLSCWQSQLAVEVAASNCIFSCFNMCLKDHILPRWHNVENFAAGKKGSIDIASSSYNFTDLMCLAATAVWKDSGVDWLSDALYWKMFLFNFKIFLALFTKHTAPLNHNCDLLCLFCGCLDQAQSWEVLAVSPLVPWIAEEKAVRIQYDFYTKGDCVWRPWSR